MCSSGGGGQSSDAAAKFKSNAQAATANQSMIALARPGTYLAATNSYVTGDDGSSLGNSGTSRRRTSLLTGGSATGGLKTLLGQ